MPLPTGDDKGDDPAPAPSSTVITSHLAPPPPDPPHTIRLIPYMGAASSTLARFPAPKGAGRPVNGAPVADVRPTPASSNTSASPAPSSNRVGQVGQVGHPKYPKYSDSTAEIVARVQANSNSSGGVPGWEAAREAVLKGMVTSDNLPTPATAQPPRARKENAIITATAFDSNTSSGVALDKLTPTAARRGRPAGRGKGAGRGRGAGSSKRRGAKRKRSDDDDDNDDVDEASNDSDDFIPPPTRTKSGRKINRPTQYSPALPSNSAPGTPATPQRGKQRRVEMSVCNTCERGYSPPSNMIVFCDGCNTPYHQHCHDPPIEAEVVKDETKEWFCSGCKRIDPSETITLDGRIGGQDLTPDEKRRYLSSLPHAHLVKLLMELSGLQPSLPMFGTEAKVVKAEAAPNSMLAGQQVPVTPEEEEDDNVEEQMFVAYPKPGNGIRLPPESEDLEWLVDDNTFVFSHTYQQPQHELPNASEQGLGIELNVSTEAGASGVPLVVPT